MTEPTSLDAWVATLTAELDLEADIVDIGAVLDLAADAAHAIVRPAAPLTTFLAGLAAGRDGGDAAAIRAALATCSAATRGVAES